MALSVAELLAASRAAHMSYRRIQADTNNEDLLNQTAALSAALEYRMDAHVQDPTHSDPAWRLDKVPSDQLVAFYHSYLNAP